MPSHEASRKAFVCCCLSVMSISDIVIFLSLISNTFGSHFGVANHSFALYNLKIIFLLLVKYDKREMNQGKQRKCSGIFIIIIIYF